MPYLNLEKLKIETFRFHRIKAFCPKTGALLKLKDHCEKKDTSIDPHASFWTHNLHERPEFKEGVWKEPSPGFAPTFTVGKSAASAVLVSGRHHWIARLLRQGVGILTQAKDTKDEKQLVEKQPPDPDREPKNNMNEMNVLTKLAEGISLTLDDLVMKSQGAGEKMWLEDTSYEVVEIVFKNKTALARLTDEDEREEEVNKLRKAVAYFLVRSYDMSPEERSKSPLERVTEELNLMALRDLVPTDNGRVKLKNLSQSTRGFVTLGPRGAVIAYAKDFEHPNLRIAALNMIEILRGRHFNLITARTFADNTIRKLSELAHLTQSSKDAEGTDYEREVPKLLEGMMVANYLYGLVVSDPGIFLLDGSTLTRLADMADTWLNMRSLREDTERKMEALYRLWQHFQDSQRIQIIGKLSKANTEQSKQSQSRRRSVARNSAEPTS